MSITVPGWTNIANSEGAFGEGIQSPNQINAHTLVESGAPGEDFNVLDYGVSNLGIDSTTELQALISYVSTLPGGGNLYFPPGIYLIANIVSPVSQTYIGLIGAGEGSTIIRGSSTTGVAINLQQPSWVDGITFDCALTTSCMLQQSTSLIGAIKYQSGAVAIGANTTLVVSNPNGVSILSGPFASGTGQIVTAGLPTGTPTSGTVLVDVTEGDLGCTATVTYTGITGGTTLTGCTLVTTMGNGVMLTGNQIQWPISSAVSPYVVQAGTVSGSTITLASAVGVSWGMTVTGPTVNFGTIVTGVSGDTISLSFPGGSATGAFTFLPTNTLRITGDKTGDLTSLGTGSPATCIGTIEGCGANTAVGNQFNAPPLSGYLLTGEAVYDGTYTWVPMVTGPNSTTPLYPDQSNSAKATTIGSAFNFIQAHGMGRCTFINQPNKSPTQGAYNVVDFAFVNIHSMLSQGGSQPSGYYGTRWQIELLKIAMLTMGPGNISQEDESFTPLGVTTVQMAQCFMNYSTGGPALGQNGNLSLRLGPNFFSCDNIHIGEISYDIGPPTNPPATITGVTLNGTTSITVASGGFPGVTNQMAAYGTNIPGNTKVTNVSGNTVTLNNAATGSGTETVTFTPTAYKDSLANTHSGGSLGRMSVGLLRISDPYYCAGPCVLQGNKVQVGVIDIQPGSPAYIQTATAPNSVLKFTNGIVGGGIQVENAAGLEIDLGATHIYPAWGDGTHGLGMIECIAGSAPSGSTPLTLHANGVIWDYDYRSTVTNPIIGQTNLTLDVHSQGGAVVNAPTTPVTLLSTGAYSTTSRIQALAGYNPQTITVPTLTGTSFAPAALPYDAFYRITTAAGTTSSSVVLNGASAITQSASTAATYLYPVPASTTITVTYAGTVPTCVVIPQ